MNMNEFSRCNKITGVYWLKKSLEDLKIKITLKQQDGIISLPKFEEYTNKSNLSYENTTEEYIFKWQEKTFSRWEIQRYTDVHSCLNETELKYHDIIETVHEPSKIFTYIHEDDHMPLDFKKKHRGRLNLESTLEQSLNDVVGKVFGGSSVSTQHLFASRGDVTDENDEWRSMHVVFDNSDYNEESQLLFKQELTLVSLYHNVAQNFVIVMPDCKDLDLNPYAVETAAGDPWGYQYAVHLDFGHTECGEELVALLRKLLKKWERKHKHLLNFVTPPLGKKQYYVMLEILIAAGFEMNNLYIEFNIKVPEEVQSTENINGRTHISEAISTEDVKEWSFGHIVEFTLELDVGMESTPLKIFFEVISTDWWGRHRTEGYTYFPLKLDPGRYTKRLTCSRPEELDTVEAESRRFFVGGCHLIKDLEVLARSDAQNTNYKTQTTGTIDVRWSVISQGGCPGTKGNTAPPTCSSASALLMGADTALRKYKKARARLAAATRDLGDVTYHSGEG